MISVSCSSAGSEEFRSLSRSTWVQGVGIYLPNSMFVFVSSLLSQVFNSSVDPCSSCRCFSSLLDFINVRLFNRDALEPQNYTSAGLVKITYAIREEITQLPLCQQAQNHQTVVSWIHMFYIVCLRYSSNCRLWFVVLFCTCDIYIKSVRPEEDRPPEVSNIFSFLNIWSLSSLLEVLRTSFTEGMWSWCCAVQIKLISFNTEEKRSSYKLLPELSGCFQERLNVQRFVEIKIQSDSSTLSMTQSEDMLRLTHCFITTMMLIQV